MMAVPTREAVPAVEKAEPDQVVTGWRCWFVLPHENLLRPIYMRGVVWKPRQPHEAICPHEMHEPPANGCKCGIWAVLEPDQLEEIGWTVDPPKGIEKLPGRLVVGQVAMWGRMLQHDRGWRSSHGYPKHLYVFTQDAAVAAAIRDAYLVPVEYGEKASLLRQLLPSPAPPATPTTPPAAAPLVAALAAASVAPPAAAKARPSQVARVLKGSVNPLPAGPLKELAEKLTRSKVSWLDWEWCPPEEHIESLAKSVRDAQETLRRAIARGGYRVERDGLGWKAVLRENLKAERTKYVVARITQRAGKGDTTAACRVAWLAVASRWREVQRPYREAVELQASLRTKRNKITGKKLKVTTIYQKQGRLALVKEDLDKHLQALVDVPTPAYRDWRRMF